jgi:hypothetical protein
MDPAPTQLRNDQKVKEFGKLRRRNDEVFLSCQITRTGRQAFNAFNPDTMCPGCGWRWSGAADGGAHVAAGSRRRDGGAKLLGGARGTAAHSGDIIFEPLRQP